MTRAALVGLVVVTSFAAPARADQRECDCELGVTELPADGAVDVPVNARLWSFGYGWYGPVEVSDGTRDPYQVLADGEVTDDSRVLWYNLGELASRRTYTISQGTLRTRFTTSAAADHTPPAPPEIRRLAIAAAIAHDDSRQDTVDIDLDAAFDPDGGILRIDIASETLHLRRFVAPADLHRLGKPACGTKLTLRPGQRVTVTLTSIDLAGNESTPVTRDVVVADGGKALLEPCGERAHVRCGMGAVGVMFIGMVVTAIAFIILLGLIVNHFARVRSLGNAVAVPLSVLAAERLARAAQRRSGLVAAVALVGVPAFFVSDNSGMSIVATVVGCVALRGFFIARGILTMLDSGTADVEALNHRLVVRIGDAESHLDLTEDKIAAARRKFAIPPAKQT